MVFWTKLSLKLAVSSTWIYQSKFMMINCITMNTKARNNDLLLIIKLCQYFVNPSDMICKKSNETFLSKQKRKWRKDRSSNTKHFLGQTEATGTLFYHVHSNLFFKQNLSKLAHYSIFIHMLLVLVLSSLGLFSLYFFLHLDFLSRSQSSIYFSIFSKIQ